MSPVKKRFLRFFLTAWLLGCLALGPASSTLACSFSSIELLAGSSQASSECPGCFIPFLAQEETSEVNKTKRMALVGAACFAVIGTILILFVYFQLNHATRGFYSGRLQTVALFMIVILLGLAIWAAQKFGF